VRRWFDALPVHRKLMVMAIAVSAMALFTVGTGLLLVDVWRYRANAEDDVRGLARIVAENTAAAVTFGDVSAAQDTLSSVRVRIAVTRACIYLLDGRLFTGYERSPADRCPSANPHLQTFNRFGASVPIVRNGRNWGLVYVERDLPDLWSRVFVTAIAAAPMLALAVVFSFVVAQRFTRTISEPIGALASAAKHVGREPDYTVPAIATPQDEIGELVRAFGAMVARVKDANHGLLREIEERKKVEAQRETLLARERESSRLKDEFLAAVSHELRTPLNAIFGWAQLLSTSKLDEPTTARAVASIARNAHAQARVIEDLVDVSRIVTGKLLLRLQPVDLRVPIAAAADIVRPSAQAKGLHLDVQPSVPGQFVSGDRDRLQQIIWNLLSNAVKFTPSGGRVTVATREHDGVYEIEVRDTGIGLAPEFLPYAFDRFRQADGSTTREFGGLGLGLSIVKDLTELHGGTVRVSSEGLGRGASFRIELPVLVGPAPIPEVPEEDEDTVDPSALDGVAVLAVDDNSDALDLITLTLGATGARVRTVTSGIEALQEWQRQPADVLICDLAMPGIDGFDLLRRIRELDRVSGRVTRAVALSAHATAEYRQRSSEAGFLQHLNKPYRRSEMVRAVAAALMDTYS
jgi:signal transduction histidine kinase/ActR/RegA family two-component response regulator